MSKPGRIEIAEGGTLFLDEIAELELPLQAKLLQLLQDGRYCRIGGHRERQVDVRAICATNHDLAEDVRVGLFRRDLFYRINVLSIHLPPLDERREDIPLLVDYLLDMYRRKYNRSAPPPGKRVMRMLETRPWPGNIRELENAVKRYVLFGTEQSLESHHGDGNRNGRGQPASFHSTMARGPSAGAGTDGSLRSIVRQAVKELERDLILRSLEANHWNRRMTAQALRISYAALLYKMREAGVPPSRGPRAEKSPEGIDSSPARRSG